MLGMVKIFIRGIYTYTREGAPLKKRRLVYDREEEKGRGCTLSSNPLGWTLYYPGTKDKHFL